MVVPHENVREGELRVSLKCVEPPLEVQGSCLWNERVRQGRRAEISAPKHLNRQGSSGAPEHEGLPQQSPGGGQYGLHGAEMPPSEHPRAEHQG